SCAATVECSACRSMSKISRARRCSISTGWSGQVGLSTRRRRRNFERNEARTMTNFEPTKMACGVLAAALAIGCGDSGSEASEAPASYENPLYAMMIQVYDPEDRTVYVSLSNTLDIESTELGSAREFASVANFAPVSGKVLVSSGSGPTITEFDVSDDF